MDLVAQTVAENLQRIRERIERASKQASRDPSEVRLVGVTKYVTEPAIRALVGAGCTDLGESRPQQLQQMALQVNEPSIRWHLVGHLQRNKVKQVIPHIAWIHSMDSARLAKAIDREAEKQNCKVPVLIEVNCSGESAKHGISPDSLYSFVEEIEGLERIQIAGLMTMAPRAGSAEQAGEAFQMLRGLRDEPRTLPAGVQLTELSMGMSGDLEAAIAAGATMVRIGRALWDGLPDHCFREKR